LGWKARVAQREDLVAQRVGDALVGVDAHDPFVLRGADRELLLRDVAGPVALDHARSERCGELARPVRRVRVDHEDLVAERERAQALAEPVLLVHRDDAGADRRSRDGAHVRGSESTSRYSFS
jgi:hypothetical protein